MEPVPFGKYLLVERLAQGGMAEVVRAVYQGAAGVEKTVALKRILPGLDGAGELVTMFIDEARIAASLTHVNVAQVFDFGEVGGTYYLAMELVDGVDLGRLLDAQRRRAGTGLPPPLCAFIIAEAARGLAYAHERRAPSGSSYGIVHRDVSPQNVLVSYAGEVKIADFGIAKAAGKLHKTASGALMGKLRYMSPEQVNGEPLDGRSDIFALGTILWELLVGAALWNGDNPGAVSDQVRHAKVDPPSRRGAEVPPELDRIALKALERGRDARYGRAADLARELSAWLSQNAPSLTREDVGAFVQEVVPREAVEAPPHLRWPFGHL
jgi:serine/threonine protein kinase